MFDFCCGGENRRMEQMQNEHGKAVIELLAEDGARAAGTAQLASSRTTRMRRASTQTELLVLDANEFTVVDQDDDAAKLSRVLGGASSGGSRFKERLNRVASEYQDVASIPTDTEGGRSSGSSAKDGASVREGD